MPTALGELWVARLGLVDYDEALRFQHAVHRARVTGVIPDTLLLLEHPPVYTRGRRSEPGELSMSDEFYAGQGIAIRDVDRGGKVTYHGPGQLVGYPIVSTELTGGDVPALVGKLEKAMIDALREQGIPARRDKAGRGVWAGDASKSAKIGSIGLHIAENVTTHGVMVNVDNDLTPFQWIRPCGLDEPVTSVGELTGKRDQLDCFTKRLAFATAQNFGLRQRLVTRARLTNALSGLALTA
jgi:lipoyl(octanoyl) transferase